MAKALLVILAILGLYGFARLWVRGIDAAKDLTCPECGGRKCMGLCIERDGRP